MRIKEIKQRILQGEIVLDKDDDVWQYVDNVMKFRQLDSKYKIWVTSSGHLKSPFPDDFSTFKPFRFLTPLEIELYL